MSQTILIPETLLDMANRVLTAKQLEVWTHCNAIVRENPIAGYAEIWRDYCRTTPVHAVNRQRFLLVYRRANEKLRAELELLNQGEPITHITLEMNGEVVSMQDPILARVIHLGIGPKPLEE